MNRFNDQQLDIAEKVLINCANVIWATLILGNFLSPKGFDLKLFVGGGILFLSFVSSAFWLRKR